MRELNPSQSATCAPLTVVAMLSERPSWANEQGMDFVSIEAGASIESLDVAAGAAAGCVVLLDAALADEIDGEWVRAVQAAVGPLVVIGSSLRETAAARALGVTGTLPRTMLAAPGELARSVLIDFLRDDCMQVDHMERFMRDAIHEFRTPLTVIAEFAALCEEGIGGPITERQREYLGQVQRATERLCRDFDDYRDSVRLQLGTMHLGVDSVPLEQIVQRAAASADCEVAGLERVPAGVLIDGVDGDKLQQALQRTMHAAHKFSRTPAPLQLCVTAREDAHEVAFDFVGIDPSDVDVRVLQEGTVETESGLYRSIARVFGLGIAMSKLFLVESSGDLWVERGDGTGGRFVVSVPTQGVAQAASLAA